MTPGTHGGHILYDVTYQGVTRTVLTESAMLAVLDGTQLDPNTPLREISRAQIVGRRLTGEPPFQHRLVQVVRRSTREEFWFEVWRLPPRRPDRVWR